MLCDKRSGSLRLRSAGETSLPVVTAAMICRTRALAWATWTLGPFISTWFPRAVKRTSGKPSSMALSKRSSGPNTNTGSTPEISTETVVESWDSEAVKSRPLLSLIKHERERETQSALPLLQC